MCERRPGPRCANHAHDELAAFNAAHPKVAAMTIQQLRTQHAMAAHNQNLMLSTRLREALDRRLDYDSTAAGQRALDAEIRSDGTLNPEPWWRYQAALAAHQARREYAAIQPAGRRHDITELGEARERLARLEARAAADLATGRSLHQRDVRALRTAYDAALAADAHHRFMAAKGHPNPKYLSPAEYRRWQALAAGSADGAVFGTAARDLATKSHTAAAIDSWRYPHRLPAGGHRTPDRSRTITPLEGVRVAVMTSMPVRCDTPGTIHVESSDPAVREQLWRAGYLLTAPAGPITLRSGQQAAA